MLFTKGCQIKANTRIVIILRYCGEPLPCQRAPTLFQSKIVFVIIFWTSFDYEQIAIILVFYFLPNTIIFQMKLLFLQTFAPLVFFLVITNQSCLHNQYYDTISSQCIDCQSGCDQCSNSSNNCTACIPNFYLANSSCLPCPKACYSCSNPSNCTNCKSNFYLSNNSCLNCSLNCMICTADSCRIC